MNPFKAYQSAERKLIQKLMSVEKLGVTNPRRLRRLWRAGMARFVLTFAALMVLTIWPKTLFSWPASATLGLLVGTSCFGWLRRARSYQSGWLNGRSAMIDALQEASRRGLTVEDWVQGEIERDIALLNADLAADRKK